MKEPLKARLAFLKAFEIARNTDGLLGAIIQNDLHMCKWDCLGQDLEKLVQEVKSGKNVAIPYNFITSLDDRSLIKRSIEIYTRALQGGIQRVQQKALAPKKKFDSGISRLISIITLQLI